MTDDLIERLRAQHQFDGEVLVAAGDPVNQDGPEAADALAAAQARIAELEAERNEMKASEKTKGQEQ